MNRTLTTFAERTRHPIPCNDADITMLARKWLALHVKTAPVVQVYTHVAPDYTHVAMRSYGALDDMSEPDPSTFVALMRDGYPSKTPIAKGEFAAFRDALFPKPVGHEAWMDYMRDGHWKERAYYMAVQCGALTYKMVEAIHGAPAGGDQKQDIVDTYERLARYAKLHPQHAHGSAAEIGAIINQLNLVEGECGLCSEEDDDVENDLSPTMPVKTKSELVFARAASAAVDVSPPSPIDTTAYRKSVGLPPAFSHDKLIKQMALARVGGMAAAILARSQTTLGPRTAVDDANWEAIKQRVKVDDSAALDTPALRELHTGLRWKGTADDFVRAAMDLYGGGASTPFEQRYLKKYPQCDAAIVNVLLSL